MQLLNDVITYVNKDIKKHFQIIVLEHIPESIWQDEGLKNFHLVSTGFQVCNALIRFDKDNIPY